MSGLCAILRAAPYTFDSNAQGWYQSTVGYNGLAYETLYPQTPANWTGAYGAGAPDGSIYQSTNGTAWEGRPYWMGVLGATPGASLGDLTGHTLTAYFRSTGNWTGRLPTDTVYLRWTISTELGDGTYNMWVSDAAHSINLNDPVFGSGTDSDWVAQSIGLIEENFFKWPVQQGAGSFAAVLAGYDSFGLAILPTAAGSDALSNFNGQPGTWGAGSTLLHYGATALSGVATWGVDGLAAIPEPDSFLLAMLGLGMIAGLRRFKR